MTKSRYALFAILMSLWCCSAWAADIALLPHAATNADLRAARGGSYATIIRDGYAAIGDGGAVTYTWNGASTCTDDGGSCVQPTVGTGRWVASLTYPLDARIWGKSLNPTNFYATFNGADTTGYCLESSATCTLQHAVDVAQLFDRHAGLGIINPAAGTYTSGLVCAGPTPGIANGVVVPNNIWIVGTGSGSTIIADASLAAATIIASNDCNLTLQALKVTSANGSGLFPQEGAQIAIGSDFNVGSTFLGQFHAESAGRIVVSGSYTISGGAPAHLELRLGGQAIYTEVNKTVTLTGPPAFSTAFADIEEGSFAYIPSAHVTFSGPATGSRYKIASNGVLQTNAGSASYLPGNSAGSLIDGGVYAPATGPTLGVPTGLGTGGSPGVVATAGSSDRSFSVQLTTGSTGGTPASTGTVPLTFGSKLGANGVSCTASVNDGTAAWGNGANVSMSAQTAAGATLNWHNIDNGALTALATSKTYFINANCVGY